MLKECSADRCSKVPCQHGGKCLTSGDSSAVCLCPLGYTGDLCETKVDLQLLGSEKFRNNWWRLLEEVADTMRVWRRGSKSSMFSESLFHRGHRVKGHSGVTDGCLRVFRSSPEENILHSSIVTIWHSDKVKYRRFVTNVRESRKIRSYPKLVRIQTMLIRVPAFNGSSYLRYPGLGGSALSWLDLQMTLKPGTEDGVILYNGHRSDGVGDFMAVNTTVEKVPSESTTRRKVIGREED
uniref:EGF-like domain-containing protein n=1 Tax=Timema douglasi TaxID=61478 RepID=A0A7R8VRR4_TIMDO|nr:unnamed protein product [Timema douglasi]